MLYSYELETQLLAGLIKYPTEYCKIANIISDKDFFSETSKINKTIFLVLKQALDGLESIDTVILSQRVKGLRITFEDGINAADYIEGLSFKSVSIDSVLSTAKELKKYTVCREIYDSCSRIAKKMKTMAGNSSYDQIIDVADKEYHKQINLYEAGKDEPENIFEEMEVVVEERGNNPITEFGMTGPHPILQSLYGSLVRPGNITVIVARSAVGKTQFAMDFTTKVAYKHNVSVLHFDNGEMSKLELINRQCAAMSQIPLHLIESGLWRQAGRETVEKVRGVWDKVKNMKFYYYNVGGTNVDSQINLLKRFYYSKIGRGNKLIFSFDYIKATNERNGSSMQEHQVIGELVDKYKKCIQTDIVFDKEPMISMFTSVQANRSGIVGNKHSDELTEDESIASLSDRINHFCSHMFVLRNKTLDEIADYPGFGTHILKSLKDRHLGKDVFGAKNPVKMPDGSFRKNYINLDFSNFGITEKGDLRDIVKSISGATTAKNGGNDHDDVPNL